MNEKDKIAFVCTIVAVCVGVIVTQLVINAFIGFAECGEVLCVEEMIMRFAVIMGVVFLCFILFLVLYGIPRNRRELENEEK